MKDVFLRFIALLFLYISFIGCTSKSEWIVTECPNHTLENFLTNNCIPYEAPIDQQRFLSLASNLFLNNISDSVFNIIMSPDIIEYSSLNGKIIKGYGFIYIRQMNSKSLCDATYLLIEYYPSIYTFLYMYVDSGKEIETRKIESIVISKKFDQIVRELNLRTEK